MIKFAFTYPRGLVVSNPLRSILYYTKHERHLGKPFYDQVVLELLLGVNNFIVERDMPIKRHKHSISRKIKYDGS